MFWVESAGLAYTSDDASRFTIWHAQTTTGADGAFTAHIVLPPLITHYGSAPPGELHPDAPRLMLYARTADAATPPMQIALSGRQKDAPTVELPPLVLGDPTVLELTAAGSSGIPTVARVALFYSATMVSASSPLGRPVTPSTRPVSLLIHLTQEAGRPIRARALPGLSVGDDGTARIAVHSDGYVDAVEPHDLRSPTPRRLELAKGVSARGRVVRGDGTPEGGLRVVLTSARQDIPWSGNARAITAPDGTFVVEGLPFGENSLAFERPVPSGLPLTVAKRAFHIPPGTPSVALGSVHVHHALSVRGRVKSLSGQAVGESEVTILDDDGVGVTVQSATNGEFELTSVVPGLYRILVTRHGVKIGERKHVLVEPDMATLEVLVE